MFENVRKLVDEMEVIYNKTQLTLEKLTDEEKCYFDYICLYMAQALMRDLGEEDSSKIAQIILTVTKG